MAIDQGTATLAITSQERTWRINIETPMGADPTITVHREEVKTDANGVVIAKTPGSVVTRSLSAIAAQSFTVGGKTYTAAELATVVAVVADTWRTEDLVKSQAQPGQIVP